VRLAVVVVLLVASIAAAETPSLELELGSRSASDVDRMIRIARAHRSDANSRVAFLAEQFRDTPFEFESRSPVPPPGTLRVRLDRFGCTGFVIAMLALATAHDFTEFTDNLRRIRYWGPGVDSDPATGNILDFAYEVFVDSAVGQGFATDVTQDVADGAELTAFSARFSRRHRKTHYDPEERLVVARVHPEEVVTARMLSLQALRTIDRSHIRTGDLLLFTRIDPHAVASDELLIGHVAIAVNIDGEVFMMHATRDYAWRPDGDSAEGGTGIHYGDARREQLGVSMATHWTSDPAGRQYRGDGMLHGYDPDHLRPMHHYMGGAGFTGVMVLRPRDPSPP
jgi:hypothetical protein